MYNQFFGLRKDPFNMTPDPEFLYLTPKHREALAGLVYAVVGRKGFVVLIGEAGTGKTTLVTKVLGHFPAKQIQCSVIVNPTLTTAEFLEATLLGFGFETIPASKPQRVAALHKFLLKVQEEGKIAALIVDEAHKLSREILEEIRLLGNLESTERKLLQIALVGQSELDVLLGTEQLRQFKQRIALWLSIEVLSGAAIEKYIRHRWAKAGGGELPFAGEAIRDISAASQGIPRTINVICDNALMQAFGEGSATVETRHVAAACVDLRLRPSGAAPSVAPAPTPVAAPALPAADNYPMKTLERYNTRGKKKPSLWMRLAGKFGTVQKVETA